MKILIIDNYDSFTYNLVHLVKELGEMPTVVRNDKMSVSEVGNFDKIMLSPGPGVPSEAGIVPEVLLRYSSEKSILGVCLGHQAIGEAFGGTLVNLEDVFHGVATRTTVVEEMPLFKGLPKEFNTCRYHSWIVSPDNFPDALQITAVDATGNIMALRHRHFKVQGVQFHPESYLTEHGKLMIQNWINE